MSRGFHMGGAGGGGNSKELIIYDSGSWGVPYANPGNFKVNGATPLGATLGASSLTIASTPTASAIIGTSQKIDVTKYTMLKVRARATAYTCAIYVNTGLDVLNPIPIAETLVPAGGSETEYTIDLTNITGEVYISFFAYIDGRTLYVSKAWLE